MNDAIAIVLARGGSLGVPGKNWRSIAGKPCCAWTIGHALDSARVGRVVVSTDAPQVAEVARDLGVETVERPAELATAGARVDDAARDALTKLEDSSAFPPDQPLVILYANVPVRPSSLIDDALGLLDESACDSVQSYESVGKHHPWWTTRVSADGTVRPWEGEVLNHGVFRRQDLPEAYIPDGGVIALTRRALMLEIDGAGDGPHAFFGVDRRGIVAEQGSVVDIDEEADVLRAEALLRRQSKGAA